MTLEPGGAGGIAREMSLKGRQAGHPQAMIVTLAMASLCTIAQIETFLLGSVAVGISQRRHRRGEPNQARDTATVTQEESKRGSVKSKHSGWSHVSGHFDPIAR